MNKAVELMAKAMSDYACISYDHNSEIYNAYAKSAIGALRNLPTETFENGEQMLHFIRVIDNIGLAIATGK